MNFLVTKILPENLSTDIQHVVLESAFKKLLKAKDKKLIIIKAGKGYGKTSVLSFFVKKLNLQYSFYKLDSEDNNLYTLLNYLIHSIDKPLPGFITEMKELLEFYKTAFVKKEAGNKQSLINFSKAFINQLYIFAKQDFYIIIENSECIAEFSWAQDFFNYVIEHTPRNIHFIFTSSYKFPLDEKKFRLSTNVTEVDYNDLKVTCSIVKQLAKEVYSLNISDGKAEFLTAKTDGWIMGIHILLQSVRSDVEAPENSTMNETMFYFFEKEIIEGLEKKYVNALITSSLFDSFDEEFISELCKNVNINFLIELLMTKYNFILKVNSAGKCQYNPLFKEFLFEKSKDVFSPDDVKNIYLDAGKYFLGIDDKENAIRYFSVSENFQKLVPLVIQNIQQYLYNNEFTIAERWLNGIPDLYYKSHPMLLYFKGIICKNYYFEPEKAISFFEDFLSSEGRKDEEFEVKAACHIAEIKFNIGEGKHAIKLLEERKSKIKSKKSLPYLLTQLSSFYINERDLEKAYACCKEASDLLGKNDSNKTTRANLLNNFGIIYFIKGEYNEAKIYYKKSLNDIVSLHHKIQTYINYLYCIYYTGDFFNPDADIKNIFKEKIFNHVPELKIHIAEAAVNCFYESADTKKCLQRADELEKLCKEYDNLKALVTLLTIKSKLYFYEGDTQNLSKCFAQIKKLKTYGQENDIAVYEALESVTKSEEEKMLKFFTYFSKNEIVTDKIYYSFRIAEAMMNKKNDAKFLKYFNEGISESFRIQYFNCIILEVIKKRNLIDYAIKLGIDKDNLADVYSEIISRIECGKLNIPDISVYDIYLVTSGAPALYIRGEKVDDKKWNRNKFKEIFIYLFLNRKNYVTKDTLIDEFYPDSDSSYSDNIFHQFLSNLRSIWKSYGNIEYVTYENKMFHFNGHFIYNSDFDKLKTLNKKQISLEDGDSEKEKTLKVSLDLFTDSFMKGYYVSWVEDLRSEVDSTKLRLLKTLIKILKKKNLTEESIKYYNILLGEDELNEDLYYELITSYAEIGDINSAKQKYKGMLDKFEKELGEKPSAQFIKKIKDVLLQ